GLHALCWRRGPPRSGFGVVLVAGPWLWAAGLPPVGHGPAVMVAIFTVASELPRRQSLPWLGVTLRARAGDPRTAWWVDGSSFAGNVVLLAGAWVMGDVARRRREEA